MHFAPDTDLSLEFAVALANTDPVGSRSGDDELTTVEDLRKLMHNFSFSGRLDWDQKEVSEVVRTREVLRRIWPLDVPELVEEVNVLLAKPHFEPRLERHDEYDWHLHAISPDAPLADRILVETAFALIDVIRTGETDRLRICEADNCEGLMIDLSRNRSKRFCSVRCGNRMNMIAFRERQAGDAS